MRPPDLYGIAHAWRVRLKELPTSLSFWIVRGPFHPLWCWWIVGLVHLRDVPGAPPPRRQFPEAEFEFHIASLDAGPECDKRWIDIDAVERGEAGSLPILDPPDFVYQFAGVTDTQAIEICDAAVRAIVAGCSPDSDFRRWWEAALSGSVDHVREGAHPEVGTQDKEAL